MSSVHYSTLMASNRLPFTGHMKEAPTEHRAGLKSSASKSSASLKSSASQSSAGSRVQHSGQPREAASPRRGAEGRPEGMRHSLPALSSRFPSPTSTPASSNTHRKSVAKVVARMRVREKTLLGESFISHQKTVKAGDPDNGPVARSTNHESSHGDFGIGSAHLDDQAEAFSSQRGAFAPNKARTRRQSEVQAGKEVGNVLPAAWGTPRGPPYYGREHLDKGSNGALETNGSSMLLGARDHEASMGNGVRGLSHNSRLGRRAEDDIIEEEEDEAKTDNDDEGGGEETEEEFDFDEGEEEALVADERDRTSRSTAAVYQRACAHLKVQPAPAFLRQCHLTSMDLRDVRLGPNDVKPIAIALVRDCRVVFLDLSNNDLGSIGVSYVAEMLQENSTLMDLNLSATNPGREGLKALTETLRHNRTLTHLRLEENRIEHTEAHLIADIIKTVPTIQGLYLGHNRLGYQGGAIIASALVQNQSLSVLELQWNHIRRDSAVALVRSLGKNQRLRRLNLAWNGLGKEGCLALALVLPSNATIRELDLTCNRVDLMSLGFLLKGLVKNKSLKTLKIGQNPLTTDGAKALLNAVVSAPNLELSEIDITGVPVDLEFTKMLARAQEGRVLRVKHEEAVTLATSDRTREHDGTNLDRYDPVMVLFEYMKMDNLRVHDMFQFMDTKHREKLSKADIRGALNILKLPVTEHAIDVMHQKMDLDKDGFVVLKEMMTVQRDTARMVKLRQIKAKAKNKQDEELNGLHKILREVISKRTEDNNANAGSGNNRDNNNNNNRRGSVAGKANVGGKKSSVGGLQLTGAMFSVPSPKKRPGAPPDDLTEARELPGEGKEEDVLREEEEEEKEEGLGGDVQRTLESVQDVVAA